MRTWWPAVVGVVIIAAAPRAQADDSLASFLIGPVFGIRLGGRAGDRAVVGVEGGAGFGPERINLGFEHRDDKTLGYVELDPWYLVGGSLGIGVDSEGEVQPVLGAWEGIPLVLPRCETVGYQREITLAVGYRYTGVHELYATIKAGVGKPFCLFD